MAESQQPDEAWARYARELGTNLARARAARGLSQEKVAHAAGLAGFTYHKYEKGESRPGEPANPTLKTLVALSHVLQVQLAELLPRNPPDMTSE